MPVDNDHRTGGSGGSAGWDPEQKKNASIIIRVGRKMGMSRRDIRIALMTALQESTLRNLNYGDRDSLGLFQQRPSMGWGTAEQVTDPYYAARKFYSELAKIKGRDQMRLTEAAQAVQRSAYPDAYAKWAGDANHLLQTLSGKITPSRRPSQTTDPVGIPTGVSPTASPQAYQGAIPDAYGDQGIVPDIDTSIGGGSGGSMGAPMAPGLGAASSPLSGMQSFGTADDYVAATGGGRLGQRGVNNTRKAIIERARQVVGTPYVWGGTDLESGVDCSGFIQSVYKEFGIDLPRVSFQQATAGKRINNLSKLRPGDLVAWDNSSRNNGADHIAIYLGNGKIIEAPKPGTSVRIRRLGDDEDAWGVSMKI